MRRTIVLAAACALLMMTALVMLRNPPSSDGQKEMYEQEKETEAEEVTLPTKALPTPADSTKAAVPALDSPPAVSVAPVPRPAPLSKAERLAQVRETFRALAAGDPAAALRAAKQLAGNERETALLALLTEWTGGELTAPQRRAWAISNFGLEAGLGLELAMHPTLAIVWANEMTEGRGRAAVLAHAAVTVIDSQPSAAFAMGSKLSEAERRHFMDSVFSGWAQKDTEAALRWADQLDASERDAAMKAIQSEAPVGIGAVLRVQDGYPVINDILPGAPAEAGGLIRAGDRILALAQGDNAFVDVRGMPLEEIVSAMRGSPGTVLQLQVLSADARPDSAPRIVSVLRGQIKFKRER